MNEGDDAFQHDIYGDIITVERSIAFSGYNGYKLLGIDGKEKSRCKKDLDAMLDQLNIQVENPVAVLDQEEAKKFLTGKPEDKYNFFTKATEIERLDNTYAGIYDEVTELQITGEGVVSSIKKSMDMVKKLENEWKKFQQLEGLKNLLGEYKVQCAWATYNHFLSKVTEDQELYAALEERHNKRHEELKKLMESGANSEELEQRYRQNLKSLDEECGECTRRINDLDAAHREAREPQKQLTRQVNALKGQKSQIKKAFQNATRALDEARKEYVQKMGNKDAEAAQRVKRMGEVEESIQRNAAEQEKVKKSVASHLKEYERIEPELVQAKKEVQSAGNQVNIAKKKLGDLESESGSGNSLAMFGRKCNDMANLVRRAKSRNQFQGPVVGPIGAHIKICTGKEKFAVIAEYAMGGGVLDRFIVTNAADRKLFMRLRTEARCGTRDCGVFQMSLGAKYSVPQPPCEGVETVETVLNIDDDLVYNCLVDNCGIEFLALCNSKEESEQLLLTTDNRGNEGILGNQMKRVLFLPHGDFWQVRNGNRTMFSNENVGRMRRTIGVDRSAAIEAAKEEKVLIENEYNVARTRASQLEEESKAVKLQWNRGNKERARITNTLQDLNNELQQLKDESEESAEHTTLDTSHLEEDVKQYDEQHNQIKIREEDLLRQIKEQEGPIAEARRKFDEEMSRSHKVRVDMSNVEKEFGKFIRQRDNFNEQVQKKKDRLTQTKEKMDEQLQNIESAKEESDRALQKARKITIFVKRSKKCDSENEEYMDENNSEPPTEEELEAVEPVAVDKTAEYYESKIKKAEKKIELEHRRRQLTEVDPLVVYEKYKRGKDDLTSKKNMKEKIDANVAKLEGDLLSRRRRWKQLRSHIAATTNQTFDDMLQKKGSAGIIEFDHKGRKLDLVIQKDNTNDESQTADVKALSGGERSFTTLSLLLALGENLETPFRVMDEFDVFLDPMSRKIALDTMVAVSKQMDHRQFIFITPQDLSSLKSKNDSMLNIIKLKPPVRGGNVTVGGPTQQTLDVESRPL